MILSYNGKQIENISNFDYPLIVSYLAENSFIDVDSLDFLNVIDGREKKRPNNFKNAIYAILEDLRILGSCTIENLFFEMSTFTEFDFLANTQYSSIEESKKVYFGSAEEEKAFCPFDDNSDDLTDLEIAIQRLALKLTLYLGENWRKNWRKFTSFELADIPSIIEKIAKTFGVSIDDLKKSLPTIKKRQKKTITLYCANNKKGKIIIESCEAIETPKTYKLTKVLSSFGYHSILNKFNDTNKIAFTPEDALKKLDNLKT